MSALCILAHVHVAVNEHAPCHGTVRVLLCVWWSFTSGLKERLKVEWWCLRRVFFASGSRGKARRGREGRGTAGVGWSKDSKLALDDPEHSKAGARQGEPLEPHNPHGAWEGRPYELGRKARVQRLPYPVRRPFPSRWGFTVGMLHQSDQGCSKAPAKGPLLFPTPTALPCPSDAAPAFGVQYSFSFRIPCSATKCSGPCCCPDSSLPPSLPRLPSPGARHPGGRRRTSYPCPWGGDTE